MVPLVFKTSPRGGDPVPGEFDSHTLPPMIAKLPEFRRLFYVANKDGNIFDNIIF